MIKESLPRLFLRVLEVLELSGRGVQIVSDITDIDLGYRGGDIVELRRPDGSVFQSVSYDVRIRIEPLFAIANPEYSPPVSLWFKDLTKEDIPVGTEVWMVVDHPIVLKGRRFEYIGEADKQEQASPVVEKAVRVNVEIEGKGYPK